jgi:hypothetical protein
MTTQKPIQQADEPTEKETLGQNDVATLQPGAASRGARHAKRLMEGATPKRLAARGAENVGEMEIKGSPAVFSGAFHRHSGPLRQADGAEPNWTAVYSPYSGRRRDGRAGYGHRATYGRNAACGHWGANGASAKPDHARQLVFHFGGRPDRRRRGTVHRVGRTEPCPRCPELIEGQLHVGWTAERRD